MPRFSIIIPVAPHRDAFVLASLTAMQVPRDEFEVLIERGTNPSALRNCCIERARGEILAFTDDDCGVDAHWLECAASFLDEHPEIEAVGGPQLTPPQASRFERVSGFVLASRFGAYSMSRRYRPAARDLEASETSLSSANLFVRRRVFEKHGRFDPRLWPNEETELLARIGSRGCRLAYEPDLRVFHRRRSSLRDLARQCFGYGRGRARQNRITRKSWPGAAVLIPLAFLLYLTLLPILGFLHPLALAPALFYAACALTMALQIAWSMRDLRALTLAPCVLITVHLSYPLGFLRERWSRSERRP